MDRIEIWDLKHWNEFEEITSRTLKEMQKICFNWVLP
jgi:DNA-binding transcriptional regulator/RsmH inhibitor MraZ